MRRNMDDTHNEGMSSDDEMIPSENLRFETDKGKMNNKVK